MDVIMLCFWLLLHMTKSCWSLPNSMLAFNSLCKPIGSSHGHRCRMITTANNPGVPPSPIGHKHAFKIDASPPTPPHAFGGSNFIGCSPCGFKIFVSYCRNWCIPVMPLTAPVSGMPRNGCSSKKFSCCSHNSSHSTTTQFGASPLVHSEYTKKLN